MTPNADMKPAGGAEQARLALALSHTENWQRWGTYLPERQWGTVREDYSADGNTWTSFPYEMAQFRAFRWGEDGLLGWTDRECRLCYSTTLWNGADPHLKERLFGLTNPEGNHGEDVKELFFYLDATPTGSYAKALYKYPQGAFPYADLRSENHRRGYEDTEYELLDTGAFHDNRYFDVQIEYAKQNVEDTLIRITVTNRGPDRAPLFVLPTVTLRNNWSWHTPDAEGQARPRLRNVEGPTPAVRASHATLGEFLFTSLPADSPTAELLITENETNFSKMNGLSTPPEGPTKDAFDRFVVHGETSAVQNDGEGTKAAFLERLELDPGETRILRLRLVRADQGPVAEIDHAAFDACFAQRIAEADEFYSGCIPADVPDDDRNIARQAYAGLLWSKQFYYYVSDRWLRGDPGQPLPPEAHKTGRNADWKHLFCRDVLSVPDKWEYPWFAAWDSAFHMVPMADLDPAYAKHQLTLLLREWYMHPNGQIPAYEFAFGDANPPVHAWAALEVYRVDAARNGGKCDTEFLERCFQKLLLNFTWWVNRQGSDGQNLFAGGFLGLDNIGVFDRSMPINGTHVQQADGTAWMGFYCASMLNIALELAQTRSVYEDIASKFLEHYVAIVDALNHHQGDGLWDEETGFYFDRLFLSDGTAQSVAIRSIVGLIPLFGIAVLHREKLEKLTSFRGRLDWFLNNRPELARHIQPIENSDPEHDGDLYLSLLPRERLLRVLSRVLDEKEFLSDFGIRSLSRYHQDCPFTLDLDGTHYTVKYLSAEGDSSLFGGNSNWRGPLWMPINRLLRDALEQYGLAFGPGLQLEYPSGSGQTRNLHEIACDLDRRLLRIFRRDAEGARPVHSGEALYKDDPCWRDLVLFPEYFCGDTGRGLGASHQTGWTALIANTINRSV